MHVTGCFPRNWWSDDKMVRWGVWNNRYSTFQKASRRTEIIDHNCESHRINWDAVFNPDRFVSVFEDEHFSWQTLPLLFQSISGPVVSFQCGTDWMCFLEQRPLKIRFCVQNWEYKCDSRCSVWTTATRSPTRPTSPPEPKPPCSTSAPRQRARRSIHPISLVSHRPQTKQPSCALISS